jgi:hypothetical protein
MVESPFRNVLAMSGIWLPIISRNVEFYPFQDITKLKNHFPGSQYYYAPALQPRVTMPWRAGRINKGKQ